MKTTSVTVSSAAPSAWIPVDTNRLPFNVGFGCTIAEGTTATYTVQHTFDSLGDARPCSISRSTTTATVTLVGHGLAVGDSVIIQNSGSTNLDGTRVVAAVSDADTFTYTVSNTGATASVLGTLATILRVFDHPDVAGETAKADGNYAFPCTAIRLNVSAYTDGAVTLTVAQGG